MVQMADGSSRFGIKSHQTVSQNSLIQRNTSTKNLMMFSAVCNEQQVFCFICNIIWIIKEIVDPKMNILTLFTNSHVISNLHTLFLLQNIKEDNLMNVGNQRTLNPLTKPQRPFHRESYKGL